MSSIQKLELFRTEIPLTKTYKLSFGNVECFESLFVCLFTDGGEFWAETTPLHGYSPETPDDIWERMCRIGKKIVGEDNALARIRIVEELKTFPFSATAFLTALDAREYLPDGQVSEARYPIVGIVSGEDPSAIENDCRAVLAQGFETLKFKIGKNVNQDIENVRAIQSFIRSTRVKVRLDANQGYSLDQTVDFLRGVPADGIEYIEQPLARENWRDMELLKNKFPMKFLLDESVWEPDDIDEALRRKACDFVKLKLYKHGGLKETEFIVREAVKKGFNPVIGNGVATDLGCFYETLLAQKILPGGRAGEMNGYLKQSKPLLENPLGFDKGMVRAKLTLPRVNRDTLEEFIIDRKVFK